MRIRLLAALAAVIAFGGAASAQPAKAEPTVELRLRSVDDLIGKGEYLAGLVGQEEVAKQVRQIIKQLSADGKGLAGIDTKRQFGLTATLTADVVNSPILVLVPIADQDTFLQTLKDRDLTAEKAEDGTFKIPVPIINELFIRFANDYAYIGRTVKSLDAKTLPAPKAFFAKDDGSVGSLAVHFDRIPPELKAFVLGQVELGIAEQRKKNGPNESPAQKAALDWFGDNATSGIKSMLEDAKDLNVKVFIEEKSDDISAELTLTAKSGSTLSKNISGLSGKTSVPAAIIGDAKNAAVRVTAKAGLPDGVKKDLGKVVDGAIDEIVKQAGGEQEQELIKKLLTTLAPTLKAGELDFALSVVPDAKGKVAVIAAVGVKGGKDIEKLAKDLAAQFGPMIGDAVKFEFDVEKIGNFALHTVTINALPGEAEDIFGTKKVWVATSDDYIAVSIEPEGAALKAGLKAKPVSAPVLSVDVATAKLLPIVGKELKPDEVKAALKDAFGDGNPAGKDTIGIIVTGGEQLTVKGKVKGNAVRLLFALGQLVGK